MHNDSQLLKIQSAGSTNTYLSQRIEESDIRHGYCVYTQNQPCGRGLGRNTWFSGKNKNLCCSFFLKKEIPAKQQFFLSMCLCLATLDSVQKEIGDRHGLSIKWPNDIYFQDRKLAGILIEHTLRGASLDYSILGLGLNVNQEDFPEHLPNPVSIKQITTYTHNVDVLLQNIQQRLLMLVEEPFDDIYHTFLKAPLYRKGIWSNYYSIDEKAHFLGRILSVTPEGLLIVETEDREQKEFYFKTIEYQ